MNSTKTHISRREFKYQIPCWDHLGQSHRRFQNSSPKAQVPRFRALAEPKVQDTEPKIQEADTKMSCGDPSSQKPAFKTQDSTPKNHSISWDGDRQIPELKTQVPETNDSPWYVLIQNPNPRMSKGADPKLGSESVITRGRGNGQGFGLQSDYQPRAEALPPSKGLKMVPNEPIHPYAPYPHQNSPYSL